MSDFSKLKTISQAYSDLIDSEDQDCLEEARAEYEFSARVDVVLALIAEVERLEGKNSNQCASIREYQDLVMGGDVSIGMLKSDLRVTTDERDQLKTEVERLNDEYDKAWRHDMNDKNNVQALAAEVISLSKDAARYRWLRDNDFDIGSFHPAHKHNHQSWFEYFDDESIDYNLSMQSK